MKSIMIAAAAFIVTAVPARAEKYPEIVTHDGVAFSHEDDSGEVTAYDPVAAYNDHSIVVANCAKHAVKHLGAVWCFASEKNKRAFLRERKNENGNRYVPFAGGRCAYGVSNGRLDPAGDPRTAVLIRFGEREQDEALVLNGSMDVRTVFLRDTAGRMSAARQYLWSARELRRLIPNEKFDKE